MAPDDTAVRFGLELRYWRERQCLSQAWLAGLAGYSPGAVSRLESGTRVPSRQTVLALADALYLTGAARVRFLSLAGMLEYPLDNDTAAALCTWQRNVGITAD